MTCSPSTVTGSVKLHVRSAIPEDRRNPCPPQALRISSMLACPAHNLESNMRRGVGQTHALHEPSQRPREHHGRHAALQLARRFSSSVPTPQAVHLAVVVAAVVVVVRTIDGAIRLEARASGMELRQLVRRIRVAHCDGTLHLHQVVAEVPAQHARAHVHGTKAQCGKLRQPKHTACAKCS